MLGVLHLQGALGGGVEGFLQGGLGDELEGLRRSGCAEDHGFQSCAVAGAVGDAAAFKFDQVHTHSAEANIQLNFHAFVSPFLAEPRLGSRYKVRK